MIDTYFDRADWPVWMNLKTSTKHWEDPRYFEHQLYSTMIERNVAEAKANVRQLINKRVAWHRVEIGNQIKLSDPESVFEANGSLKKEWKFS